MNNSRARSAKNAWGTSTGYADQLLSTNQNMDAVRAQQLENWHQQREISAKKQQQKYITEQFDNQQQSAEADWRTLAKFGVERNQVGYICYFCNTAFFFKIVFFVFLCTNFISPHHISFNYYHLQFIFCFFFIIGI